MIRPPSYDGRGLVNLVSELERRLIGRSPSPPLAEEMARFIPPAPTYVLVLFDGLGDHQLAHRRATPMMVSRRARLDAPFPSTTAVSMSCVATGLTPRRHGIVGYQMWFEGIPTAVNVLRWTTPWGDPIDADYSAMLPSPNLWERLSAAGVEPITVQPGHFEGSPFSDMLYRGCRFEPVWSETEIAEATLDLASKPGRLVFTYVPHVDVAAHTAGQSSDQYEEAVTVVTRVWEMLAARAGVHMGVVGTADHGHRDYTDEAIVHVQPPPDLEFAGEPRALYVRGPREALDELRSLPATTVQPDLLRRLWGPPDEEHPSLAARTPSLCLLADEGRALLVPSIGHRWVGFHGGLEAGEREVPLLVA